MSPFVPAVVASTGLAMIAFAAPAAGDVLALSDFGGKLDDAAAGFAGPWRLAETMKAGDDALVGTGWARRPMLRPIDFDADGEYFLRYTLTRQNVGGANDYGSLALFNSDSAVKNRPMHFGISSGETFDFGLVDHVNFGERTANGKPYTVIARLVTSADAPDRLEGWGFPADKVPDALPAPHMTAENDYDRPATELYFNTGNLDGLVVTFEDVRVATDADSVLAETPEAAGEPAAFLHDYRPLRHLRVADHGTHALPIQWANITVLPAQNAAPTIVVQSSHEWLRDNLFVYEPATAGQRASAEPAPNADLPLYGPPTHETSLPGGNHLAVPAGDGEGYALIHAGTLRHTANLAADGTVTRLPRPVPTLGDDEKARLEDLDGSYGTVKYIGDVDGDGVADALLAQMVTPTEKWTYWPRNEGPWVREPRDNVGPNTDVSLSEGFRGYDISGQWLGTMRTNELTWMKGQRDDGKLTFGPRRPVYHGTDDVVVQWRTWSDRMSPAVVTARGVHGVERTHVALFNGYMRPLALPVLSTSDGELRLGEATPLLADDQPMTDLMLTLVRGVFDVNGDGVEEILTGSGSNGRLVAITGDQIGDFRVLGALETVGGVLAADTLTVPASGDWDGDGLADLVTGDGTGYYLLWPGTSDPLVYGGSRTFTDTAGEPLVFKGDPNLQGPYERGWSYSQPDLFDWDGDGELEIIGNDNTSTLRLHDRVGGDLTMLASSVFTHNGHKLGVAWRSRMTALPGEHGLAGDDRPVLLYLGLDAQLKLGIPADVGSTDIVEIVPLAFDDGEPLVISASAGMSGRTQLSTPDWDGDGVWDVLYNSAANNVSISESDPDRLAYDTALRTSAAFWLRNRGTNAKPVFERPRRITWKDGGIIRTETHSFNVEPVDLNGDGELDLVMGDGPGFVYGFYRDEISSK